MSFQDIDKALIVALIAINLTLLGLTTLAEAKKVLGVDYGKFLINKATLFLRVKYKHVIAIFTGINIIGVIAIFYTHIEIVLIITSVLISLSTILLLIYFVSSVLYINKRVRREIYLYTLSGLYSSKFDELDTNSLDYLLDINPGSQTDKTVVSDVYNYFNEDSFTVLESFEAVFGPKSFLYHYKDHERKISYFWDKHFINKDLPLKELKPYHYRNINNNYDVTHEFFLMYRYSKLQSIWAKKVYELTKNGNYNIITYSNLLRITKNTVNYLNDDLIKSFDFIKFITAEYISNVKSNLNITLKNSGEEFDFNKLERIFLEDYTELINTSLIYLIDGNKYEEANKITQQLKLLVNEKTFLNEEVKRELVTNWFRDAKEINSNFNEEIISFTLKVLDSK